MTQKSPIVSFEMDKYIYDNIDTDEEAKELYDDMIYDIVRLGYFVANKQQGFHYPECVEDETFPVMFFEVHPKYIIDVSQTIYEKTPGILYHLTTRANLEKIIKRGLIPRNRKSYVDDYPGRVYFFFVKDPYGFRKQAQDFYENLKTFELDNLKKAKADYDAGKISRKKLDYAVKKVYDCLDWVVLEINLKNEKAYDKKEYATTFKFFDDPKSQNGIFTYENVDPLCINTTPLNEIHIDKDDVLKKEVESILNQDS